MSPLRRPIAALGLVAIAVTAAIAGQGQIGLVDAGLRAGAVLLAVRLLDAASSSWLRRAATAAARVSDRGIIRAPAADDPAGT